MNPHRRHAAIVLLFAAALAGPAWAAPPLVEVFAYAHPPVAAAIKPVREMLAHQGAAVRVVEIDLDKPEAEKRLAALGVKGHVAAMILVDGQRSVLRADGKTQEFINFPAGSEGPAAMRGTWTVAELEAVLAARKAK
jgi:hypothetical protein